ncbi:MAG TPA: DUF6569 family protein [Verrucomicrobiae bacterium]|jgi:hypothetical protein|nr:DUF6569 family protein [Verrucomicrobiae bacterium]
MKHLMVWGTFLSLATMMLLAAARPGAAGNAAPASGTYRVLAPITHGDLTIFPVVADSVHDTSGFLTLDEGMRTGEVVVTEVGKIAGMMRRRPAPTYQQVNGAEVNRLVLVNNSKRPLILLAGEVVTGGKQDRVVGKDRIVPAESDPVDLSVFCVEHGRWVESSAKFDTHASVMAQPSVRKKVMADKQQQQVWDEVGRSKTAMAEAAAPKAAINGGGGGVGPSSSDLRVYATLNSTTSYAKTRENPLIQKEVDSIVAPMQKSYESAARQLREQNAVGVVIAVKGHIIWADIFASNALLAKYWPKLLESYAAEALTMPGTRVEVSSKEAQQFVESWQATHEVVDSEPGLYRQREITGDRFKAFELTSLLPKENFDVHLSKMAE